MSDLPSKLPSWPNKITPPLAISLASGDANKAIVTAWCDNEHSCDDCGLLRLQASQETVPLSSESGAMKKQQPNCNPI